MSLFVAWTGLPSGSRQRHMQGPWLVRNSACHHDSRQNGEPGYTARGYPSSVYLGATAWDIILEVQSHWEARK
jgi:hypothetical protein